MLDECFVRMWEMDVSLMGGSLMDGSLIEGT